VAIAGTLAHRYLREIRGITLMPPDVRFHPACPMGRGPSPRRLPALLVGVFERSASLPFSGCSWTL
jgi:hypothetical protein